MSAHARSSRLDLPAMVSRVVARYYLRKPEYGDVLRRKLPTMGAIFQALANELFYRTKLRHAVGPSSVVFELTNKCNLTCTFCPVNRGMERAKGFMSYALFEKILTESRHVRSINLCHWGESLLHPKLFDMIALAGRLGIETTFYTNGLLLTDEKAKAIVESSLGELVFSVEGDAETHRRVRGFELAQLEEIAGKLVRARNEAGSSVRIGASIVVSPETEHLVDATRERWSRIVDAMYVQPLMTFEPGQRTTRCRELWRGSLVVLWDGSVVPCGVDYEGTLKLGDAKQTSLDAILNGAPMQELRRAHNRGSFPRACGGCSEWKTDKAPPRFQ